METVYRRPNTSKPAPGHRIYPYLLRGLAIDRPNQVWAMDITYVPMARGFIYLAAVMDWFSRRVLSWRVSITMDDLCLGIACCASSGVAGLPGGVLVFGFHGFSSERKFSIHKAPLETYMSKLCV